MKISAREFKEVIKIVEPLRDPIHGDIDYNVQIEREIIDTQVVQRLRRLYQIQAAYLVYPGADHKRFQHSLGTMHLSGIFAESLLSKYTGRVSKGYARRLVQSVRMAGLLHDIGHGPYSHAFDDAIITPSSELEKVGIKSHEDIAPHLIEYSKIGKILEKYDLKDLVLNFLVRKPRNLSFLEKALRGVVREWLYPADIMDFVLRDAHFTGFKVTFDARRLIRASRIYKDSIVMEERALRALDAFLYARFQLFENVYRHRTCRAVDKTVRDILEYSKDDLQLIDKILDCEKGNLKRFLELDDYSIIEAILRKSKAKRSSKNLKKACNLVCGLRERNILWCQIGEDRKLRFRNPAQAMYFDVNKAKGGIEKTFRNRLREKYGETEGDGIPFWVDHTRQKYLPDNPFELTGRVNIFRMGKIEKQDLVVFLGGFLSRHPFLLTFRIYTTKNSRKKYSGIAELANKAISDALRLPPRVGVVM